MSPVAIFASPLTLGSAVGWGDFQCQPWEPKSSRKEKELLEDFELSVAQAPEGCPQLLSSKCIWTLRCSPLFLDLSVIAAAATCHILGM